MAQVRVQMFNFEAFSMKGKSRVSRINSSIQKMSISSSLPRRILWGNWYCWFLIHVKRLNDGVSDVLGGWGGGGVAALIAGDYDTEEDRAHWGGGASRAGVVRRLGHASCSLTWGGRSKSELPAQCGGAGRDGTPDSSMPVYYN